VFWWYEKKGVYKRCEVLELTTGGYEFRTVDADGNEQVEHFSNPAELAKRQEDVARALTSDGWTGPHGWVL
jgi:hypothetical protein